MMRGGERRSPRISALDVNANATNANIASSSKAQPSRPTSPPAFRSTKKYHLLSDDNPTTGRQETANKKKRKTKKKNKQPFLLQHTIIKSDQNILLAAKHTTKHEDRASNSPARLSTMPHASWMPERRILELIIDILQRRDTHEIFGEPVDAEEVEDYYEIIEEPMDFGTMRAKLHEGMYKTLEQFQYDVFLITRNAMHFNSSATIYFRQARAIDELAQKVFHLLKIDPDNFELEFSEKRRRSSRRPQSIARCANDSPSPELAVQSRPSSMTEIVSTKPMPCSTSRSSNQRRAVLPEPGCSGTTTHSDARCYKAPFGCGDSRNSSYCETDRRSTYKSWMSLVNENNPIIRRTYSDPKLVLHVNQQDVAYHRSLMSFVESLGPAIQVFAEFKMNGWKTDAAASLTQGSNCWSRASNIQNYMACASGKWISNNVGTAISSTVSLNLSSDRTDIRTFDSTMERILATDSSDMDNSSAARVEMDMVGLPETNMFEQNQSGGSHLDLDPAITDARDLNVSVAGLNSMASSKSALLKLKKSNKIGSSSVSESLDKAANDFHSIGSDCRLGNSHYSFPLPSGPLHSRGRSSCDEIGDSTCTCSTLHWKGDVQATGGGCTIDGHGGSSETGLVLKSSEAAGAVASEFMFDVSFLKTRLDQLNNSLGEKNRYLQQQQQSSVKQVT